MSDYTTRTSCRICGNEKLEFLFSLGLHYVNNFVEHGQAWMGPKAPIELVYCPVCTLVQNPHTVDMNLLYKGNYWYRSGVTQTMQTALRDIVVSAMQRVDLNHGDAVLDIGSNDGTLLRNYPADLLKIGVEPAKNLASEPQEGVDVLINDFWSDKAYWKGLVAKFKSHGQESIDYPKIITAIGMFYDLDDPNQFIADIAKVLHPEGIFIAQLTCLKDMLDTCDIGNLAHEHLEFYSLPSLIFLFQKHGLRIVDIETNSVNVKSTRLYVRHISHSQNAKEQNVEAISDRLYGETGIKGMTQNFFVQMEANRRKVRKFIEDRTLIEGKSVWVYGASTKGNTLLQYFGIDHNLIDGAAERSPEKYGKVTIGTNIQIHSEEDARSFNPDYFLVLPYTFIDEFIEREKDQEWRKRGGKFIVPLPELKVL